MYFVTVDANRTYSGEWNLEKEMAASENVEDLRLELSKDEDEKLFPEVSDVFGKDNTTTLSATDDLEYRHHVDESPVIDLADEVTSTVSFYVTVCVMLCYSMCHVMS